MLVTGVATLAYAQAPISGLAAQADSRVQADAEVVSRILANRPAYTGTGERVGRVATVTVASDRASIIAIVALRPGFGRGQIAVPASNLRQVRYPGHTGRNTLNATGAGQLSCRTGRVSHGLSRNSSDLRHGSLARSHKGQCRRGSVSLIRNHLR